MSPYREDPPPRDMQRWFYWSPAHWRRWQVVGVVALALGACGRRAGCGSPPPAPTELRTHLGKPGWHVEARNQISLQVVAGRLCKYGWIQLAREYGGAPWSDNEYIIQCDDAPAETPKGKP